MGSHADRRMLGIRWAALILLIAVLVTGLLANWIAPAPYDKMFRTEPNAPPGRTFFLGTDYSGRDRFSRLIYGTRISLLLAPAAAALSLILALFVGGSAGLGPTWWDRLMMAGSDLMLSLPWLFLFLTVRAVLPLNTGSAVSIVTTFILMGMLGWGAGARVIRAAVLQVSEAPFTLYAHAFGCEPRRLWFRQFLPHLRVVLLAQFWVSIPTFILGEASLGLLGLGVADPMPSWGNLLRELQSESWHNYWVWTPVLLLAFVMILFQLSKPLLVNERA